MLKTALFIAWHGALLLMWAVLLTAGAWLWHLFWFSRHGEEPPAAIVGRWVLIVAVAALLLSATAFSCHFFGG